MTQRRKILRVIWALWLIAIFPILLGLTCMMLNLFWLKDEDRIYMAVPGMLLLGGLFTFLVATVLRIALRPDKSGQRGFEVLPPSKKHEGDR